MRSFKQYIVEGSGIAHLHDADSEFFGKLMSEPVLVSIKVDSAAIVIMNDAGTLRFFNRGAQKEIDLIRRAGMDVYEGVISHIESRDWKKLPSGVMFFCEFFHDRLKSLIKYTKKPHNNLILLFAKKGGKILRADDPVMDVAAGILDVSPPPIIFSGMLNQKQKNILQSFVETEVEKRKQKFGLDNFRDMILSLFGVEEHNRWLVDDGLEGIVFLFGSETNPTRFKVVDPAFTQRIQDKIVKGNDVDSYRKAINEVMWNEINDEMVDSILKKVKPTGQPGFIEFVSELAIIVGRIGDKHFQKYKNLDASPRMFGFTSGITPSRIIEMAKAKFYFEDVFRQLLFTLNTSKVRISPATGINAEAKVKITNVIDKLKIRGLL